MSKNFKPILVVAGDPKSIFLEIYFKSLKTKKFLNPLILIVNKRILTDQMKLLKYQFKLNELQSQNLELFKLNNDVINYINIPLNSKRNNITKYNTI